MRIIITENQLERILNEIDYSIEQGGDMGDIKLPLKDRISNFINSIIKTSSVKELMEKIKTIHGKKFRGYTLVYISGQSNSFVIDMYDGSEKVGRFMAFLYEKDGDIGLQIQKVEIEPKYRGKGIMRTFYMAIHDFLKNLYDNFKDFSSDYIFLLDKSSGTYPGFEMWEDMVRKGKAVRVGPEENYIPPKDKPKMWFLKTGYNLIDDEEQKETEEVVDTEVN
jgi:hypothetical protein